eukprot:m.276223 g.276223  ORF g.276223 m.276223 type:complete len:306 (+) comp122765_c0_seq1:156-1073(+)
MATQVASIKVVKGITPTFVVDGFNFVRTDCKSYFLTHYHGDHTTGLHAAFDVGLIYCSPITARLLTQDMRVAAKVVVELEMNETIVIEGVHVTPLCANHCPGAVMFHFHDDALDFSVLHVGDFRAAPCVVNNATLAILLKKHKKLDILYLDTTYCKPRHTFPDQGKAVKLMGEIVVQELSREPNTLFLCGSYTIGKENAIEAVAKAASSKTLVSLRKARILKMCGRWNDDIYTTVDTSDVRVRVGSLDSGPAAHEALYQMMEEDTFPKRFSAAVAFRPTGWCYSPKRTCGYTLWSEEKDGYTTRM